MIPDEIIMKTAKTLFQELRDGIFLKESPDEIESIAWILLDHFAGISRNDVMSGKVVRLTPELGQRLQASIDRINREEPVQYVLGEAHFYGRNFQVNPAVLIPRPETEGLVLTVLTWRYSADEPYAPGVKILDIGTGSGCIATTLSLEWSGAEVYATDVSPAALSVASANAHLYNANITFIEHNILEDKIPLTDLDIIVSNPPYVVEHEKSRMKVNVLAHEPHLALFVPEDDPLVFYKHIVSKAHKGLRPGGLLAVEINEKFGNQVSGIFLENGFENIAIISDVAGKPRIVSGERQGSVHVTADPSSLQNP
jgi:release factor glutamine methyltransferase